MFLQAIDTVLAFAMIMLLLSLMVTVLVQAFVSVLSLRGTNVLFGLRKLVGAVAPELSASEVKKLAKQVQEHANLAGGALRSATQIDPQDVLLVLGQLRTKKQLSAAAQGVLDPLFENGLSDDSKLAASLDTVRSLRTNTPDEAEKLRLLAANVLGDAKEIVVRIDSWFDTAMHGAEERLKLQSRWVTAALALVIAVGLQVDSPELLRQLWRTPESATKLVVNVDQIDDLYGEFEKLQSNVATANGVETAEEKLERQTKLVGEIRSSLLGTDLTVFHALEGWKTPSRARLLGSLLTALLLSLGAPFWYGVVGKLVGFRNALVKPRTAPPAAPNPPAETT